MTAYPDPDQQDAHSAVGRLMELVRTLPPRIMRTSRQVRLSVIQSMAHELYRIGHAWRKDAEAWREHSPKWGESLNRRATIESLMFDAAKGARPMPDASELREWALRLGTRDENELRSAVGVRTGVDPDMGFILEAANKGEIAAYDYGCEGMMAALQDVLDGKDDGAGVANEPWQSLRERVLQLVRADKVRREERDGN